MDRHRPWSGGLHVSSLVTLSAPSCTWKLCMCPGLCGNGLTVSMNNEVGESLAFVSWGPQLLRTWLLKLTASPLFTVCSCLRETNPTRWDAVMTVAEMRD